MIAEPLFSIAVLAARVLLAAPYLVSSVEKSLHFQAALEEFALRALQLQREERRCSRSRA